MKYEVVQIDEANDGHTEVHLDTAEYVAYRAAENAEWEKAVAAARAAYEAEKAENPDATYSHPHRDPVDPPKDRISLINPSVKHGIGAQFKITIMPAKG